MLSFSLSSIYARGEYDSSPSEFWSTKSSCTASTPSSSIRKTKDNDFSPLSLLQTKARNKQWTNELIQKLTQLDSPLHKKYWNTWHCCHELIPYEGRLRPGFYCKNRWCLPCARIETARLSRNYLPTLQTWTNPQLVTLTVPNCLAHELPQVIKQMLRVFARLNNRLYKQYKRGKRASPLVGLRKLECTTNGCYYHPHFHVLIRDLDTANDLRNAWLYAYKLQGAIEKAQCVVAIESATIGKTLNYLTKPVHRPKQSMPVSAQALDLIFQTLKGKQLIQDYKQVPWLPPLLAEALESKLPSKKLAPCCWSHKAGTWVDCKTGHHLT